MASKEFEGDKLDNTYCVDNRYSARTSTKRPCSICGNSIYTYLQIVFQAAIFIDSFSVI